ncbi:hypothetical protein A8O14_08625 [Polynucleobacter wuianus]|uniref:Uncharacterized protein n=1 Tax=Polynucleobacter wuianus TaxID=1743168 RepID=A0A191UGK4_9BURK|nr:hypothetical protein A8O14_08625 [Polynucleobacter wuianus]
MSEAKVCVWQLKKKVHINSYTVPNPLSTRAFAVWQCRYKVDNKWIRATTKETKFDLAMNKSKELLVEVGFVKILGLQRPLRAYLLYGKVKVGDLYRFQKGTYCAIMEPPNGEQSCLLT